MYSDPTGCFSLGEMSAAMSIQMTLDDLYNVHISAMISGLTSMTYTILKGGGAEEVLKSFTNGYATGLVFTGFGKLALVSQTVKLVMAVSALGSIGAGYYQAWKDYQTGDKEAAVFLAVLSSFGAIGWARQYGGDVVDFVGSRMGAAGGTGNNAGVGNAVEGASKTVDDLPSGWTKTTNNGFTHIKDANGNIRVRIDPPDAKTSYPHKHLYDDVGNSLDINGNIVSPKSPDAHIPLK